MAVTGQPFDTLEPAPSSVGLSQGCAEGADSNVDLIEIGPEMPLWPQVLIVVAVPVAILLIGWLA